MDLIGINWVMVIVDCDQSLIPLLHHAWRKRIPRQRKKNKAAQNPGGKKRVKEK